MDDVMFAQMATNLRREKAYTQSDSTGGINRFMHRLIGRYRRSKQENHCRHLLYVYFRLLTVHCLYNGNYGLGFRQ